jgi:hypothetical protein
LNIGEQTDASLKSVNTGIDLRAIMASESFEDRMERACKDLEIPGAILVASDKDGMFENVSSFSKSIPQLSY